MHRLFAMLALSVACNEYNFAGDKDIQGGDSGDPPADSEQPEPQDSDNPLLCDVDVPQPIEVALNDVCDIPYQEGSFTPIVEWNLAGHNAYGPPAVGQLNDDNGDGVIDYLDTADIVYSTNNGGGLISVNGKTGGVQWTSYAVTDGTSGQAIGDVDGDGVPEIAAANGVSQIVLLDNNGQPLWQASVDPGGLDWFMYPAIADLDGDGLAEIIAGRTILNHDGSTAGIGSYGVGGCENASYSSYVEGSVAVPADMDGDGDLEVVVGNAAYHKDGSALWYNGGLDGIPAVADMDLDGEPEVVVIGRNQVWTLENDGTRTGWFDTYSNTNYLGPPAIDDLDGDGQPEFVTVGSGELRAYEWDGSVIWGRAVQDASGAAGPILFDFEMDGYPEVVYADETMVHVFNGLDGSVKLESGEHSSYTGFETPVVADVDGDDQVEIVMTHGQSSYGLSVYGDADQSWPPGRSIWNQHGYSITNVEDYGGIPAGQTPNWEQYNNFRSGDAGLPPSEWNDLQTEVVEVCLDECPERIVLSVRIWNRGTEDVEGGVTIQVLAGSGGAVLDSATFSESLRSGWSSDGLLLEADMADLAGEILVVALDESQGAMTFMTDCDTSNNAQEVNGSCE